MKYNLLIKLSFIASLMMISGCSQLSYYSQSMQGQWEIVNKRRPIADWLADEATPATLKKKLEAVTRIRAFASRELGLPDNNSYKGYADLQRPYVVWNVFAADELSLKPREWCFPVAGCVGYKGYFAEAAAQTFAAEQTANGLDVFLGPVPAYSTLGYFDDPVLNTFIHYPEWELARLIFHELSHQVVYVKDDSVFNESFATAVEREGLRRWLAANPNAAGEKSIQEAQQRREDFNRLLEGTRKQLDALYASDKSATEKRAQKKQLFDQLLSDYQQQKVVWGGYAGFDRWINAGTNNAVMAAFGIYNQQEPAFSALLANQSNDLPAFYREVKAIAKLDKTERSAKLAGMLTAKK
jgi:predicted aminopeptidase